MIFLIERNIKYFIEKLIKYIIYCKQSSICYIIFLIISRLFAFFILITSLFKDDLSSDYYTWLNQHREWNFQFHCTRKRMEFTFNWYERLFQLDLSHFLQTKEFSICYYSGIIQTICNHMYILLMMILNYVCILYNFIILHNFFKLKSEKQRLNSELWRHYEVKIDNNSYVL